MKLPRSFARLKGFRFPREIIAYAVWAYHRFAMSTADVEDLLAERGILVSRETVRLWVNRFGRHFASCIRAVRHASPDIRIEILTPDFRGKGRMERALEVLREFPPDVFNHNLETVPHLYREVRPGADYQWSLDLLKRFKAQHPEVPTKSGIMLGLGETHEQVLETLRDLRDHDVEMITIGQYLQPTPHHHPVVRYWTPEEFDVLREAGEAMGFHHVASGPLVRSSYHADLQAHAAGVTE